MQPPSLFRIISTVLLLGLPAAGCSLLGLDDDEPSEPKEGQTTVLFIGSSYLQFNNVPDRFRDLSRKAGEKVYVRYHLALAYLMSGNEDQAWQEYYALRNLNPNLAARLKQRLQK